jgi:23S rRNA U2552 (ribose-2'-O)-methylase RlmE/FtsJ
LSPINGLHFTQTIAELIQSVAPRGKFEGGQEGVVDLLGSPTADRNAAVQQDLQEADQARVVYLAELALDFAVKWLKPEGNFLVKTFQGVGFPELREAMRGHFRQVLTRKPQASRGRSSEIYLLGKALSRQA